MQRESNQVFVLEHALEMILFFGDNGIITYANAEARKLLQYEDALIGTHISNIFPNDFQKTEEGFVTEIKFGETIQSMMAYRKNRTCFRAEVKCLVSSQCPNSYFCVGSDVSKTDYLEKELSQVNEQLTDVMKVKSEFVANVTHELRTPVNGVLGNTRDLMELEIAPEKRRILDIIERSCINMNQLINNILDFSKLEAGKFTIEKREFDFRKMIDYVRATHISKITEKGLQLFITISPDIPQRIIGDELRISQVLNNLLSNACKFTSVGKIAVEAVRTAQVGNRMELFFMVIDSGVGIDKKDQDKLFKSFTQVDNSISRKYGGTGLGLNISKQLVEMMGGTIGVESEKNKGTMFNFSVWVELPESELDKPMKSVDAKRIIEQAHDVYNQQLEDGLSEFGNKENLEEIRKKMSKLILSVEMQNWEKAEMFMETLKQLTEGAPREVKNGVLKLKMAVQKADYDKIIQAFENLQTLLG